jgi:5-methylcytosine-specific restriction endonuclease McrA
MIPPKITIDHVVPLELLGENMVENIQPLCVSCRVIALNVRERLTTGLRTGGISIEQPRRFTTRKAII